MPDRSPDRGYPANRYASDHTIKGVRRTAPQPRDVGASGAAQDDGVQPLWQLNEYANIDRHRQLSVIYSDSDAIEKASVGRRLENGTSVPFERDDDVVTDLVISAGALVHGGELMRFKPKREVPNLDVEYSAPQSIDFGKEYISLGPASDALNRMHEYTRAMVLPNLAPFFWIA